MWLDDGITPENITNLLKGILLRLRLASMFNIPLDDNAYIAIGKDCEDILKHYK